MAAATTRSMLGHRIIDRYPDVLDAFWDWEQYSDMLVFGIAEWFHWRAVAARDRFCDMCFVWYESACREYDSKRGQRDAQVEEWESILGSRMSRGHVRWMKDFDFSDRTIGGMLALFVFR